MKKILSTLIVFVISVCNVFGAISQQGIINAINEGRLGDYLLIDNHDDIGVQQFIRHTEKHFCDPGAVKYSLWNQLAPDGNVLNTNNHTILGDGNWGPGGHINVLKWILNSVKSSNYTINGNNINIVGLKVCDVKELTKHTPRHTLHVLSEDRNHKTIVEKYYALNKIIACTITLNATRNGLNVATNALGVPIVRDNGTAGTCFVVF